MGPLVKTLDARHGKESAWICFNFNAKRDINDIMVNFKPINKNDITKRLRIFASNISILPNAQIEICIENLGDLPIDLSMEIFCWDRELDETQSVGNIMFKLKPNESKNLANFKMDDVRVKCGNWKMDGIDFRVHFKPHF